MLPVSNGGQVIGYERRLIPPQPRRSRRVVRMAPASASGMGAVGAHICRDTCEFAMLC